MEPDEVGSVTALLGSLVAMGPQVQAAAGLGAGGVGPGGRKSWRSDFEGLECGPLEEEVPGWRALTLTADLLGSDFPRFLQRRNEIVDAFKKEEALRLMTLSWRPGEGLAPEEAWSILAGQQAS